MRPYTVLIVDDIATNIDILSNILSDDYRIQAATSGPEAIDLANSDTDSPDIILLDIMMPGMDGYTVLQKLKINPLTKDIPVIFITTKTDVEDEEFGLELGAVDYITKPVNASITRARVSTHLALRDQSRILEEKVRSRTAELQKAETDIIHCLSVASQCKHDQSGQYASRIQTYTEMLARAMNMDESWVHVVSQGAPLYDIGKLAIPDDLLYKTSPLSDAEWLELKKHCQYGVDIISEASDSYVISLAKDMALYHHEWWDGSGYPKGLKGDEIPLVARMLAIIDVFEALTSARSYKNGWSSAPWEVEDAIMQIQHESGTHFDPKLVNIFSSCFDEVRLTSEVCS